MDLLFTAGESRSMLAHDLQLIFIYNREGKFSGAAVVGTKDRIFFDYLFLFVLELKILIPGCQLCWIWGSNAHNLHQLLSYSQIEKRLLSIEKRKNKQD
ncbi:hypothetical protein CFP56_024579 [Quercus suber]|uniref:Uncharacterized protein n=1 Tax=Quercus suber TaxID=58331 RepID=A0AAW0K7H3_QUESU